MYWGQTFSKACGDRIWGNGFKLRMDVRGKVFVMMWWIPHPWKHSKPGWMEHPDPVEGVHGGGQITQITLWLQLSQEPGAGKTDQGIDLSRKEGERRKEMRFFFWISSSLTVWMHKSWEWCPEELGLGLPPLWLHWRHTGKGHLSLMSLFQLGCLKAPYRKMQTPSTPPTPEIWFRFFHSFCYWGYGVV